jgi:hypothetical protein
VKNRKSYGENADHHIWNNNGTLWCHYTIHGADYTKRRIRLSLKTKDPETARALRDDILKKVPEVAARGWS